MNDKIDLTIDRDFSNRTSPARLLRAKFPWSYMPSYEIEQELLYTGNKDDIASKKLVEEEYSGMYCARCGRRFYPYSVDSGGLCLRCEEELNDEFRRDSGILFPWSVEPDQRTLDEEEEFRQFGNMLYW